ncbi:CD1247 N-terminal domain-containing protein [Desulfuribacillus alkaliarsenatis]|uniref:Uncharacterized protein n=1 Tax=Desulfuribacillus alkaliarsenatis TaxID=766136 RepID=A0A1E5G5N9_9FIRM|nr:CD1247 N-terminal domain-containing protein [Desulfuribacillus alkaliarsenatis]OEF98429.1 hypothetical protein BHF68_01775 [Desulfuribacillus alkaliarsenatis]
MLERISYMKGLAEGLELDYSTKEGRLLKEMIHVMEDMSFELQQLQSMSEDMEDYVVAIDDDLQLLEQDFYEEDLDELDYDDYDYEFANEPIYLEEELDIEDYEDEMM